MKSLEPDAANARSRSMIASTADRGAAVLDPWMWHMRRGEFAAAWAIADAVLAYVAAEIRKIRLL